MNQLTRIVAFVESSYRRWFVAAHIDTSTNEMFVRSLVKDINKAHHTLKIVEDEGNIGFYNDRRVVEAFKNAFNRGVKIQIVLKPPLNKICDQTKAGDP